MPKPKIHGARDGDDDHILWCGDVPVAIRRKVSELTLAERLDYCEGMNRFDLRAGPGFHLRRLSNGDYEVVRDDA